MAYINLTGDSNGDLHNAEMHNAKFGAIASVINGNIDSDNLAAPQSYLNWSISTDFGTDNDSAGSNINTNGVLELAGSTKSVGTLGTATFTITQTGGKFLLILNSLRKAPADMTLVSSSVIMYQQNGSIGDDFNLYFQKASTITGTYSDMANGTFNQNTSQTNITPSSVAMSVSNASISSGEFFRVIYEIPTAGYPNTYDADAPILNINLTFKAYHIA